MSLLYFQWTFLILLTVACIILAKGLKGKWPKWQKLSPNKAGIHCLNMGLVPTLAWTFIKLIQIETSKGTIWPIPLAFLAVASCYYLMWVTLDPQGPFAKNGQPA